MGGTDANGKNLSCAISRNDADFNISIDESNVAYPLQIDVLITAPSSWSQDSDQAGARFGHSLACAGDVNGDGFADVIVGSRNYSNAGGSRIGLASSYLGGEGQRKAITPRQVYTGRDLPDHAITTSFDKNYLDYPA